MIFLFEEHPYDSKFLESVVGYDKDDLKYRSKSGFNTEKTNDGIKINGVGYCFYNGQPVFVLPKVFVENETKAFGIGINDKGDDVFGNQPQSVGRGHPIQPEHRALHRHIHHENQSRTTDCGKLSYTARGEPQGHDYRCTGTAEVVYAEPCCPPGSPACRKWPALR